jgi:hypothetical protein
MIFNVRRAGSRFRADMNCKCLQRRERKREHHNRFDRDEQFDPPSVRSDRSVPGGVDYSPTAAPGTQAGARCSDRRF